VELNNRLSLHPDEVLHARLPKAVSPGWHGLESLFIELFAHADVERAGDGRRRSVFGWVWGGMR
jgi:hypothetical protein